MTRVRMSVCSAILLILAGPAAAQDAAPVARAANTSPEEAATTAAPGVEALAAIVSGAQTQARKALETAVSRRQAAEASESELKQQRQTLTEKRREHAKQAGVAKSTLRSFEAANRRRQAEAPPRDLEQLQQAESHYAAAVEKAQAMVAAAEWVLKNETALHVAGAASVEAAGGIQNAIRQAQQALKALQQRERALDREKLRTARAKTNAHVRTNRAQKTLEAAQVRLASLRDRMQPKQGEAEPAALVKAQAAVEKAQAQVMEAQQAQDATVALHQTAEAAHKPVADALASATTALAELQQMTATARSEASKARSAIGGLTAFASRKRSLERELEQHKRAVDEAAAQLDAVRKQLAEARENPAPAVSATPTISAAPAKPGKPVGNAAPKKNK